MKQQPDLTIVIPAYREEKRIGKTLDELSIYLKNDIKLKRLNVDILVVTADSPDKTKDVVINKKNSFKSLTLLEPGLKKGKGRDVQFGMLRAKGKVVMFMDADLATPLKYINIFYELINNNVDIVIATRNLRKHHKGFSRRLLSNIGNLLFRVAGGVWVEDSQCGFKMFKSDASKLCFERLNIMKWGFDMEILAIAKANNLKILSYRVNDWVSVPNGTFMDNALRSSLISFIELLYVCWNRIMGKYKVSKQTST